MKKFTIILLLSTFSYNIYAQLNVMANKKAINIIPKPVAGELIRDKPGFVINAATQIYVQNDSLLNSARFLADYLQKYYNLSLQTTTMPRQHMIKLISQNTFKKYKDNYALNVRENEITINGSSGASVFYGIQSLIQLLPPTKSASLLVPALAIVDFPRFNYRGMHLDVSRHFFDIAFIKKYIDYLALNKLNYFHWHLTDDHGWRIEIKKYPKLTEVGAWRDGSIIGLWPGKGNEGIKYQVLPNEIKITPENAVIKTDGIRYGGFYTQEEIKEVIDYAAKRYITIIPEIEMPAHSMALLAAYPEFGTEPTKKYEVAQTWGMMNKYNNVLQPTEKTFKFLEDILTEVMALFPSKYIHIGGDEASKVWWRRSPVAQQVMKDNNLKDENALQSYFIQRMEKFVNSKGKIIIGWDEILDGGLAPNAIVMSWRGEKGGIAAAREKHQVIMTPSAKLYFNHGQFAKPDSLTANGLLSLETVYRYEPVPAELIPDQAGYIWGVQGDLWSEYVSNPAKAEYMLFPRIAALSEVAWSAKANKNYADFLERLKTEFKRYDLRGVTYSKRYLLPPSNSKTGR